jgi:hypothetical protein
MRGEPCFTVPFSPTPKLHLTSQYQTSLKFATVAEPCPSKCLVSQCFGSQSLGSARRQVRFGVGTIPRSLRRHLTSE